MLTEAARAAFATGDIDDEPHPLRPGGDRGALGAAVNDIAASLIAEQALGDAVVGDAARARSELQRAIGPTERRRQRDDLDRRAGRGVLSASRSRRRGSRRPTRICNLRRRTSLSVQIPMLRAAAALASNEPRQRDCSPSTARCRTSGPPIRGCPTCAGWRTWRFASTPTAVVDFQMVIGTPGNQPTSIVHPLSRLQLARAARAAGDLAQARQAYADFAAAWGKAESTTSAARGGRSRSRRARLDRAAVHAR